MYEITIKVAVDTIDNSLLKPSQAKMVSELSRRIEQMRLCVGYETVEVTSVTVNDSNFVGESDSVTDVSEVEVAITTLVNALVGSRTQQ